MDNNSNEVNDDRANQQQLRPSLSLSKFRTDLDRLSELRPAVPDADASAPRTIISAGSSYTRLWTADTWRAHSEKSPLRRYWRHVRRWPASTTARKVMPTVLVACAWSVLVKSWWTGTTATATATPAAALALKSPSTTLSLLTAPLALLLTLRANASLSRLLEARLFWGRLVLYARSLASLAATYVLPHRPIEAVAIGRHLACLGWALKSSVRNESLDYEREVVQCMFEADDDDDDGGDNNDGYCELIMKQPKRTAAITTGIRRQIASCVGPLSLSESPSAAAGAATVHLLMEQKLAELEQAVGGCERLATSPIPPTYSRHLSRVMFLWLLLLPLSLAGAGLSTPGTVLATAVGSYVTVGL